MRSKIAFGMALALLLVVLAIGGTLPETQRTSALIGIIGLLVTMQAVFLYANRGMVNETTQALHLIYDEKYEEALALLEPMLAGKPDTTAMNLAGTAYRMTGRLDESRDILTKVVQTLPNRHFPLYNLGRTLMASGLYADAVTEFTQAQALGAPGFVRVDLAEACFRASQPYTLDDIGVDEPHIMLMADYLRWQAGEIEAPDSELVAAGLSYWENTARRFSQTPYGADLQRDIARLREYLPPHT